MNKLVKGSVAGAAGVALLMGSFGTFALWSDEQAVAGGKVQSGVLSIDPDAAVWKDESAGEPRPWAEGALIVPGDKITRTQTFTVTATGANMKGALSFDAGAIDTGQFGDGIDVSVDVQAPGLDENSADKAWRFDAPLGTPVKVTTTVTFAFDKNATVGTTQGATAEIKQSTFKLEQVRP
jgi:alternate signal-mediated exported protein